MSKENALDIRAKFRFAKKLLRHRFERQRRVCPYCGVSSGLRMLRRKKLIMDILQCEVCHLIFRWPTDTPQEHEAYYQEEFAEDTPQVVPPKDDELRVLMQNNFLRSPLDINDKILALKALRPAGRVLDFGCSWAYGTYQIQQHGYDVMGFEISKPRAEYGRCLLGQKVIDTFDELHLMPKGSFDIIFSNHVLEHILPIGEALRMLTPLLAEDGIVFHVLPNFTGEKARTGLWLNWIGEEHPIAPTMEFFEYAVPRSGLQRLQFGSSPFDEALVAALTGRLVTRPTDGDELLVLAKKTSS